jgi:hypothetical protein
MPNETIDETIRRDLRWPVHRRAGLRVAIPVVIALALLLGTSGRVWASSWAGSLVLSPPEGPSGTQVTATAHGAPAGDPIVIGYTIGNCSASVTTIDGGTGTVDTTGTINVSFAIPGVTPGTYTICVIDQRTHQVAQAQLTVLPTPGISVSKPVIEGQPVTVSGQGWLPTANSNGGTVEVLYGGNGCATSAGMATVGSDGTFTITFNAPYETSNTTLTITAVEPQGSCGSPTPGLQVRTTVSVTVPTITVPQSVDSGKQITVTGANFSPNGGAVEIRFGAQSSNGCATSAGTATVGSDGTFTGTFNAPSESKDTTITIVALQPQGSCGQTKLAATGNTLVKAQSAMGFPLLPYCVVALLLLLLLLLLMFLLFRRRKKDEPVTIEERDRVLVGAGPAVRPTSGVGGPGGMTVIDRQIVARDRRGHEVVIAEEVTTVEEEEEY